jgi:hypothetical protein
VFYCSTETIDFRGYSLPSGVFSIVPSGLNVTFCASRIFLWMNHTYHVRTNVDHLMAPGFWRRVKWLKSAGYPIPPPLVLECKSSMLLTSPLCTFLYLIFCSYFSNQSMANCSIHLRMSLVNYVHGKIILTRLQTLILGSMFGRYFQEMLLQTYPEVLSNLLRSMVIFVVVCSLLSCDSI